MRLRNARIQTVSYNLRNGGVSCSAHPTKPSQMQQHPMLQGMLNGILAKYWGELRYK